MIEAFREAFANRYRLAREERERGRPVIGWVCSYVPEEIFYAARALPLRILGGREETPQGRCLPVLRQLFLCPQLPGGGAERKL